MDMVSASMIPEGSTLARAYWSVPRGYINPGPEFETDEDALTHAVAELQAEISKHEDYYRQRGEKILPLPESITLDLRWKMTLSQGGSHDVVVSRKTYDSVAEAQAHLARIEKYRK